MTEKMQGNRQGRAWGETIASSPELRALMEQARDELAAGLSEDEVRQRTLVRARREALAGIHVLFPNLPRRVLRAPVPLVLRALADHLAKQWKLKRVRDGAAKITEALGWDEWLLDFILEWAKTGEPGAVLKGFQGGVYCAHLGPKDDKKPLVVLVASPMSDLDALIEELRATYQREMPRASLASARDPETRARWVRLFAEGLTDRQIAEREIAGRFFVDEAERRRELRLMVGRIKSGRKRWRDQVTEILGIR